MNAKVGGIMCAYNRTDSVPCCGSKFLLQDILRNEWGFKGYVVTDCWALDDIFRYHKFVKTPEEAAAMAVKNGINVECGNTLNDLQLALKKGLVTESDINTALKINAEILFKLGWFDPKGKNPYDKIPASVINNNAHRLLAKEAAIKSMVLLSNKNHTLPLSVNLKNILVTGPNADETNVLLANYNGISGNMTTILEGITNTVSPSTIILHNKGCDLTDTTKQDFHWMINDADAVIAVLGLSPLLEGENGDAYLSEAGGDKKDISFPYAQLKYLKALKAKTNKPIIVVLTAGSAIELGEVEKIADAVLLAWYPGEQGGNAVADILFGKANPGGRLPITFYKSNNDLPAFDDYNMKGRTYRFFTGEALHPFGYGLSYSKFTYTNLKVTNSNAGKNIRLDVTNTSHTDGDEVVQLYIRKLHEPNRPLMELKGYKRIHIIKGKSKTVTLLLPITALEYWDDACNAYCVSPGDYEVLIGNSSKDIKLSYRFGIN